MTYRLAALARAIAAATCPIERAQLERQRYRLLMAASAARWINDA